MNSMIPVKQFGDKISADLARGFLESCGIESMLIDNTTSRTYTPGIPTSGVVTLHVREHDKDVALKLLAGESQEISERKSASARGFGSDDRCAQCGSSDFSSRQPSQELMRPAFVAMLLPLFSIIVWPRTGDALLWTSLLAICFFMAYASRSIFGGRIYFCKSCGKDR